MKSLYHVIQKIHYLYNLLYLATKDHLCALKNWQHTNYNTFSILSIYKHQFQSFQNNAKLNFYFVDIIMNYNEYL